MEKISQRIREIREKAGVTQDEAAQRIGIGKTTYVRYEQGEREPNLETIIEISRLGNVSTDYILNGEEFKQPKSKEEKIKEILDILHELPEKSVKIILLEAKKEKIRNE